MGYRRSAWVLLALLTLAVGYFIGRHASQEQPKPDAAASVDEHRARAAKATKPSHGLPAVQPVTKTLIRPTPLPPAGAPLKEIYNELKARADAGEADAASRLYGDLNKCLYVSHLRQTMHQILPMVLEGDDKDLSAEQLKAREAQLGYMQKDLDLVHNNEALCSDIGDTELHAVVPLGLEAAQLGDLHAANCYLGTAMMDAPGLLDHPEWLTQFKDNALPLANAAVERGDWVAVGLLEHAYGGFFAFQLLTQLTGTDPVWSYRYLKLQRLGASGDFATKLDKQLPSVAQQLTPEQIADADAWAQDTFTKYFNGSSSNELSNGTNICPVEGT